MGSVIVPDLVLEKALQFCDELDDYVWEDENNFEFGNIKTCDPFPMLVIAHKIKETRANHGNRSCKGLNVSHSYATNMRFFRFIGMDIGKPMSVDYGNSNYQPISSLRFVEWIKESRINDVALGETITEKSRELAKVLSRGDEQMTETMTFCLREIIRNIPEHSCASNGWYCAQYWPTYNLVELAILDDGIGILNSINSNYIYACERLNNEEAIIKALQPGISRTYDENENEEIFSKSGNKWKNSGYGLFVVSRICAKTGGSFVLASGDKAVLINQDSKGEIRHKVYDTSIRGTAIRIRIKVDKIHQIETIMKEISEEGKTTGDNAFKTASQASMLQINK